MPRIITDSFSYRVSFELKIVNFLGRKIFFLLTWPDLTCDLWPDLWPDLTCDLCFGLAWRPIFPHNHRTTWLWNVWTWCDFLYRRIFARYCSSSSCWKSNILLFLEELNFPPVVRQFVLSNRRFLCPDYHPILPFCGDFRFGEDTDHGNMDGGASSLMYRQPFKVRRKSESMKSNEQILVR